MLDSGTSVPLNVRNGHTGLTAGLQTKLKLKKTHETLTLLQWSIHANELTGTQQMWPGPWETLQRPAKGAILRGNEHQRERPICFSADYINSPGD